MRDPTAAIPLHGEGASRNARGTVTPLLRGIWVPCVDPQWSLGDGGDKPRVRPFFRF